MVSRQIHTLTIATLVASFALAALAAPADAKGRKPADVFKTSIKLSDFPFPPRFEDDKKMIKYVNRVDQKEFWAEKDGGDWVLFYMAFLEKPLESRGYVVQFFDVTDPDAPVYVTETTSWPGKSGVRITAGEYSLSGTLFKPDKKYLMLFSRSSEEAALAEAVFVLRGFDPAAAGRRNAKRREAKAAAEAERKKKNGKATWTPPDW
jgi:hypothetical protein